MIPRGEKSELLKCLEPLAQRPQNTPCVDLKILDRVFLVHTLDSKSILTNVKTFKDYTEGVFIPYLKRQLVERTEGVGKFFESLKKSEIHTTGRVSCVLTVIKYNS